jgi:hypothetical protein
MRLELDNPYRPLAVATIHALTIRGSLLRGIACALPIALIGFAVPFVAYSILTLVRHYILAYPRIDMRDDFRGMPVTFLGPGIGCSLVFGLAAILNYSPPLRIGFVRATMFVGLAALSGIVLAAVATIVFQIGPQSYTSDPWLWLRILIGVSPPVAYTAIHTVKRFARPDVNAAIAEPAHASEPPAGPNSNSQPSLPAL